MFSSDAKIFEKGSAVRARMVEYGELFERLHIVVVSKGKFREEQISQNVVVEHEPVNAVFEYIWKIVFGIPKRGFGGIDVVTAQDPFEIGYIAYKIARQIRAPLQLQIHTDFLSPYFRKESVKNFIRYVVSKITIPKADGIRVVSKRIKDSLSNVKCQTLNVSVLPIFIDAEDIKNARARILQKKFDFTVLWVGRFEREKNPLLALQAFSLVFKKIPNAGLVVVGDGSLRKELELRIKKYGLSNNVITTEGWQDGIAGYYKSADVLLITSWYEGYGMNMVEARIVGTPVVAPDVGVAKDVGAHITGRTAEEIAQTLIALYERKLPKSGEYEYPYTDKERYLRLYRESFEQCLKASKKI